MPGMTVPGFAVLKVADVQVFETSVTWTARDAVDLSLPGQERVSVRDIRLDGSAVSATVGGRLVQATVSQAIEPDCALAAVWFRGKHFSFEFPFKLWEDAEEKITGMIGSMLVAPMTSTIAKVRKPCGPLLITAHEAPRYLAGTRCHLIYLACSACAHIVHDICIHAGEREKRAEGDRRYHLDCCGGHEDGADVESAI